MKFKNYNGETLKSATVTYKLDGVRVHYETGEPLSRAGKKLYNVPIKEGVDIAEVYLGTFKGTISSVKTKKTIHIDESDIYSLHPILDPRLIIGVMDIDEDTVKRLLDKAISMGLEGLVIHHESGLYKVKPVHTIDLEVIGLQEGTGRNEGRLGALITEKGKVGTGFTDKDREELYTEDTIGKVVEVSCMEVLPSGKLRHPRFVRMRPDKEAGH